MRHPVTRLMFAAAEGPSTEALKNSKSQGVRQAKVAVRNIMHEACAFVDKAVNDMHDNHQIREEVVVAAQLLARLKSEDARKALYFQIIANVELDTKLRALQPAH